MCLYCCLTDILVAVDIRAIVSLLSLCPIWNECMFFFYRKGSLEGALSNIVRRFHCTGCLMMYFFGGLLYGIAGGRGGVPPMIFCQAIFLSFVSLLIGERYFIFENMEMYIDEGQITSLHRSFPRRRIFIRLKIW